MSRHLGLADVMALARIAMRATDSAPPVFRAGGEGLLESAVLRPQMAEHYEQADLIRQAALLAVGISQAQAFLDGNKRAAYQSLLVFLRVNGCTLDLSDGGLATAHQLELVATRPDSLDAATDRLEAWLRRRVLRS